MASAQSSHESDSVGTQCLFSEGCHTRVPQPLLFPKSWQWSSTCFSTLVTRALDLPTPDHTYAPNPRARPQAFPTLTTPLSTVFHPVLVSEGRKETIFHPQLGTR